MTLQVSKTGAARRTVDGEEGPEEDRRGGHGAGGGARSSPAGADGAASTVLRVALCSPRLAHGTAAAAPWWLLTGKLLPSAGQY